MIDISIVVPIYNTPEIYLEKCILAMLNQTKENIEIILVNDGSTNDALSVCYKYSEIDKRIIVIDQHNQGVSVARNSGIDIAQGEWIAFIDPDDWIDERYLESLWKARNKKTEIVIGNCYINEYKKEYKNDFLPFDKEIVISDKNILMSQLVSKTLGGYFPKHMAVGVPWGKIFNRKFLNEHNIKFIPGMVRMQDNVFCLYALYFAKEIVFTPERYYHYRKENDSVSFKFNKKIVDHFEKYFIETERFINNNMQSDEKYLLALNVKRVTSFNSYFKYFLFHQDNKMNRKDINNMILSIINLPGNKKALDEINLSYCTAKEKIFIILLKNKLFFALRLVYLVI
ncbi:glycosyltransferase [Klebsiella variicola]|uniref:glycosyltransferase n=1 Tax=Klebsiella variicola TaxID=244366 RepID=UPI0029CE6C59|nr:glycosyltransferase [Klebsiella variicola]ELX9624088.1 glycosyltransferase [Klebsiella variicola]ELY7213904.1 glycosyltransferase [Klebsiella variicola]ELY7219776.1 glycosyltransferase [Klebsiella variicola]ELZ7711594.1 glycosyltransferase [Klebsiella variicola]EMA8549401.1 glycosyltransferase [Klebsiella variicola]